MINHSFKQKVRISGILEFKTAFHIGSGKEGELSSNMGVLLEPDGRPILPGSTLKGSFRTFAERLAEYLELTACLMDTSLSQTVNCVSGLTDQAIRKDWYEQFKKITNESQKYEFLKNHVCDVCHLLGSPMHASRIFFSDGTLIHWSGGLQVRDGVCIDRDTETAREGAKYDFEAVPCGATFKITIDIENPEEHELALIGAVLAEWKNGFRLGGFSSRGLGKVSFTVTTIEQVDYTDRTQLKNFLLDNQMTSAKELLDNALRKYLEKGGPHAEKND
jgi:CRISPR-associated RAMP protein (TIGR02581 family)